MQVQLSALLMAMAVFLSADAHSQSSAPVPEEVLKEVTKDCEEPSSVLAEARLRKWEKSSNAREHPITAEQRAAVFAVMKDQCVAVQLVLIMRTLRSKIPMAEWSKLNADARIEELLARIERTL